MTTLYEMIHNDEKKNKATTDLESDVHRATKERCYKLQMILPGVFTRVEIKCTPAAIQALVRMFQEAASGLEFDRPIINVIDGES